MHVCIGLHRVEQPFHKLWVLWIHIVRLYNHCQPETAISHLPGLLYTLYFHANSP